MTAFSDRCGDALSDVVTKSRALRHRQRKALAYAPRHRVIALLVYPYTTHFVLWEWRWQRGVQYEDGPCATRF